MINAEIINGEFILYNNVPNIVAIELHYKGQININSTLPEGWFLRANNSKIIIVNLGTQQLSQTSLFKFEGKLNINVAFAVTKKLKKHHITTKNPKRNWSNSYFLGSDITNISDNWDTIKNTHISTPKNNENNSVNSKGNKPVVNIPMKNNLYTKGKEYMLNKKEYIGYYHIHTDIGVAMSGKQHNAGSKMLNNYSDQFQKPVKSKISTPTKISTQSSTSNSGGY
jgi:hypothetical protein